MALLRVMQERGSVVEKVFGASGIQNAQGPGFQRSDIGFLQLCFHLR